MPAKSLQELVAYAKANPGKLSFASGNTSGVVAGETFKSWAGIDIVHRPYRSTPPAMNDLLAGRASMMFTDVTIGLQHVNANRLRALATTRLKRSTILPDLPTLNEAGVRDFDMDPWAGLFAPAGTPREIVVKLNTELRRVIENPETKAKMRSAGLRGVFKLPRGARRPRQSPARKVDQDDQGRGHPARIADSRPPGWLFRDSALKPARRICAEQETHMRPSRRQPDELRAVSLERGVVKYAEGSCFVKFGDTHVLVTATLEDRLPPWLKGQGRGWVTAEYGMLPRATHERTRREASAGKQSGRTIEIQRLIGRSLRSVIDLPALGERQISIDCDVIQADGGTRTASITGAWVALHDCLSWMRTREMIKADPLRDHVAAVSCGVFKNVAVLDLDYAEDSDAETDANFIMTGSGNIVEVQATAEKTPFSEAELLSLLALARKGIGKLVDLQKMAVM